MAHTTVNVPIYEHEYKVTIGRGLLAEAGRQLRKVNKSRRIALITDGTVAELYGMELSTVLARSEYEVIELVIPTGEDAKTWAVAGSLVEEFAAAGLGRKDIVLALGGGAVGDVAGFAASVYLRGVKFAQMPTTLLAMVDSSVGGKTGVNLAAGKNLAGSFKQPEAVLVDVDLLKSLPDSQWQSGFAEVVKTAMIDSEQSWWWIKNNTDWLAKHHPATVIKAINRSLEFKARVVVRDERETGPRECLNYGHTLGHAIEKLAGYGTFTHGQAVAEGMRFAARLAVEVSGAPVELVLEQDAVFDELGLPALHWSAYPDEIVAAMRSDKKSRSGKIRFVLPSAPGVWECVAVEEGILMEHLEAWHLSKNALGVDTQKEDRS